MDDDRPRSSVTDEHPDRRPDGAQIIDRFGRPGAGLKVWYLLHEGEDDHHQADE